MLRYLRKSDESAPLKLEHLLIFLLGLALVCFATEWYEETPPIGQVIILIVYLGLLVGIAPLPIPSFRSRFAMTVYNGAMSGVLDSYIILDQCKRLRTVEAGQDREQVAVQSEDQKTIGVRARFLALQQISALIGGLIIWFGEVYAAGLYMNDQRTGVLSALYIVPPAFLFLAVLGIHAQYLPIEVVPNKSQRLRRQDLIEFAVGIILLLVFHNPLYCLGWLLMWSVVTRQDDHLIDIFRHHTEINVMLVLFLALVAGAWLVENLFAPLGLDRGQFAPIIPSAAQAVLWGPLYEDSSVHFWVRIANLSTGALLLPISSLVGVMLFPSLRQWWLYLKYSIPYAVLWYGIMRGWIWLTLESPIGKLLEQWAHSGAAH